MLRTLAIIVLGAVCALARGQEGVVENRPYTDLRPVHFGIVAGMNMQDTEFTNVGPQVLSTGEAADISCDQSAWDIGFHVGVLAEFRLSQYVAFRLAPQLYFNTRQIEFRNNLDAKENIEPRRQDLRTVYVGADCDLVFASKRWGNRRPYVLAGIAPMYNLTTKANDYVRLKSGDVFVEFGLGCDFYLPFFKLRPELKFMYGLTNCLDKNNITNMKVDNPMLPYASSIDGARSKMLVLSFYFE